MFVRAVVLGKGCRASPGLWVICVGKCQRRVGEPRKWVFQKQQWGTRCSAPSPTGKMAENEVGREPQKLERPEG